jgi:hypothetical protein
MKSTKATYLEGKISGETWAQKYREFTESETQGVLKDAVMPNHKCNFEQH